VAALVLLVYYYWENRRIEREAAKSAPPPEEVDPFAGGFPVPPLPGQRLREPALRISERSAEDVPEKEATRG